MLRANVGLSRKISRDFNSTGYSVNLDGEIPFAVDDPQAVLENVKELFSLAQEAINQEIDRDQSEDGIGRRDEERPAATLPEQRAGNPGSPNAVSAQPKEPLRNNGSTGKAEAATNKQV